MGSLMWDPELGIPLVWDPGCGIPLVWGSGWDPGDGVPGVGSWLGFQVRGVPGVLPKGRFRTPTLPDPPSLRQPVLIQRGRFGRFLGKIRRFRPRVKFDLRLKGSVGLG